MHGLPPDQLANLDQSAARARDWIIELADRAAREGVECQCPHVLCGGKALAKEMVHMAFTDPGGMAGMVVGALRLLGEERKKTREAA